MKSKTKFTKIATLLSVLAAAQVMLAACATTTTGNAEDALLLKKVENAERHGDRRAPAER